jgi:hypothetical protein
MWQVVEESAADPPAEPAEAEYVPPPKIIIRKEAPYYHEESSSSEEDDEREEGDRVLVGGGRSDRLKKALSEMTKNEWVRSVLSVIDNPGRSDIFCAPGDAVADALLRSFKGADSGSASTDALLRIACYGVLSDAGLRHMHPPAAFLLNSLEADREERFNEALNAVAKNDWVRSVMEVARDSSSAEILCASGDALAKSLMLRFRGAATKHASFEALLRIACYGALLDAGLRTIHSPAVYLLTALEPSAAVRKTLSRSRAHALLVAAGPCAAHEGVAEAVFRRWIRRKSRRTNIT